MLSSNKSSIISLIKIVLFTALLAISAAVLLQFWSHSAMSATAYTEEKIDWFEQIGWLALLAFIFTCFRNAVLKKYFNSSDELGNEMGVFQIGVIGLLSVMPWVVIVAGTSVLGFAFLAFLMNTGRIG